ncbi:hypothetical protein [Castellaniella sp. UC4442_H9]
MHTLFDELTASAQDAAQQAIERARAVGPSFEDFWAAWPKREAKKDARRAWDKLTTANKAAALAALPAHVARWRREGRARNHIPHPATWLNGERWEDELGEVFAPRQASARPGMRQHEPDIERPWPCTWSGIVDKGRALGLEQGVDEVAPAFKARVYAAASLDDAQRARILADWGVRV